MKTSFRQFLQQAKRYKNKCESTEAEFLYEHILSRDQTITQMIHLSDLNKPALLACIDEIEEYCTSLDVEIFDIQKTFYRQAIGRMVKSILQPFGYIKYGEKRLHKRLGGVIKSASTYKKQTVGYLRSQCVIRLNAHKASFDDFLAQSKEYQMYFDYMEMRLIFDYILSADEHIIDMIRLSDQGIPAIYACIDKLNHYYQSNSKLVDDLSQNDYRQAIEAMITTILQTFHYEKDVVISVDKQISQLFHTACTYKKIEC